MSYLEAKLGKRPSAKVKEKVLSELKGLLLQGDKPDRIYIFGSVLEDSFTFASDIDVAIFFESQDKLQNAKKEIYKKTKKLEFPTDILFFELQDFEKKKEIGGVCMEIYKKGKLIYDKRSDL